MVLVLVLLLPLAAVSGAAGDCPPKTPEAWEHDTQGAAMLAGYNKYAMRCPQVNLMLFPSSLQVDHDLGHATMKVSVILSWTDPGLVLADASPDVTRRINASAIWTPKLVSSSLDNSALTPDSVTSAFCEVDPAQGNVRSVFSTSLRGLCFADEADRWPRDKMFCHFWIEPSSADRFNLTQRISVQEVLTALEDHEHRPFMERMAAWRMTMMESSSLASQLAGHSIVLVEVGLERLPGQLEALLVQPGCAVLALAPTSAALPPGSSGRACVVAVAVLLHALHLLSLPEHLAGLEGGAMPRNVLLFRDAALLILLVVLEWLVSLHLASRRRPLPACLRPAARGLAVLRKPLLLPAVPAAAASAPRPPPDEESVGLAEVLDRLTLLAATTTYLALITVSMQ